MSVALEKRKRVLGGDHPDTLRGMCDLGALYSEMDRLDETERLWRTALEGQKRVLGEDHMDTLGTMGNLATLHYLREQYDEAEALMTENLIAMERVLGGDHLFTLYAMSNLAEVQFLQGRYAESEALMLEALDRFKRLLGEQHPQTANQFYMLAYQSAARGGRIEAFDWLEQAVAAGYADADQMAGDPHLKSVHGPEFDALVERARQNAAARQVE